MLHLLRLFTLIAFSFIKDINFQLKFLKYVVTDIFYLIMKNIGQQRKYPFPYMRMSTLDGLITELYIMQISYCCSKELS